MSAQNLAFSLGDFDAVIDDMASYFKSNKRAQGYTAKNETLKDLHNRIRPLSFHLRTQTNDRNDEVINKFTGDCQADLNADNNNFHSKTSDYTKNLESSQNEDDFDKKIDKMADDAKHDNATAIDKWRDKAKEIHKKNPEAGNAILAAFESVCTLANKVYSAIIDFFSSIIENIVQWLVNAWSSIKNFFSGVAGTIASWF